MLEDTVKCHGDETDPQVVCLQGNSKFIVEVVKVIDNLAKVVVLLGV